MEIPRGREFESHQARLPLSAFLKPSALQHAMTRLWGTNPEKMCDQHLLGEHKELHQEVGTLRNHPHGLAIVKGHAKRKQVDTSLIQDRHEELVQEMENRGFKHNSPLDYEDELGLGSIDIEDNREELVGRCKYCRRRIGRNQ